MHTSAVANPVSRNQLREIVKLIRKNTGTYDELHFPVVSFMELVMPTIFRDYEFMIGTVKEMGNSHGLTSRKEGFIKIREDVYEGAIDGCGRDRLTCAHEVGHFFLHPEGSVQLARTSGGRVKPFLDPEWQADAFAGELLVPAHLVTNLSTSEVMKYCGVSLPAARYQLGTLHK